MKYDYYYPDTVAEFEDYSNDCEPDPFNDFRDAYCIGRLEEALSLIDDIKKEDFIKSEEEFIKNLSTWMSRDEAICTMYNNLMQKLESIENLLKNK